jgi:hypothetical protein
MISLGSAFLREWQPFQWWTEHRCSAHEFNTAGRDGDLTNTPRGIVRAAFGGMPAGGLYHDAIERQENPLDEADLQS